jgi:hypothetical protein
MAHEEIYLSTFLQDNFVPTGSVDVAEAKLTKHVVMQRASMRIPYSRSKTFCLQRKLHDPDT